MNALLTTHGLTRRIRGRTIVDGVELSVPRGAVYGFLGLNGAGKSTTLRMIAGLARPTRGEIRLDGERLAFGGGSARARIGALIERPVAFGHLSARRNLELLASLSRTVPRSRALTWLERVGLSKAADQAAGTFSLGMKQRLGIALALAGEPELVLLDEPTNGLDPDGIVDVRRLLSEVAAERGTTFVISSHLLPELDRLATHFGILHGGRLLEQGTRADLLRSAGPVRHRVEIAPADRGRAAEVLGEGWEATADGFEHPGSGEPLPGAIAALVAAGVEVKSAQPVGGDLETAFLRLIRREARELPQ